MRSSLLALLLIASPLALAGDDGATVTAAEALRIASQDPATAFEPVRRHHHDHPLIPWLEYASLRRRLTEVTTASLGAALERHADSPASRLLREAALREAASREDWQRVQALWAGSEDPDLRCIKLLADHREPLPDAWIEEARGIWLHGRSRPKACDPVFAILTASKQLTATHLWQRIDLAIAEGSTGLIRHLAASLPDIEAGHARELAAFLDQPAAPLLQGWPQHARSRSVALAGVERLARRDPGAAEKLLAAALREPGLSTSQHGRALNQIALWSAASYLPETAARMARVPAAAWDAQLHEWRAREAMARKDDQATLRAIRAMPADLRGKARWRWFEARLLERGGSDQAQTLYRELARETGYFGFLAAERAGLPYALCPLEIPDDAELRESVRVQVGLVRALQLYQLDRPGWARLEWQALMARLDADQRRIAVDLAQGAGWADRAISTLNRGADLRFYRLRFPLAWRDALLQESRRHGLDPAWVAALIRAESGWAPDARSSANARGLMQLLPATARLEARRRGQTYPGDAGLFQPLPNLRLGTAHLATLLERHDGLAFLATAAYNAGPTPVARWLQQRGAQDIDFWLETIPYHETRAYVPRILAFSVIYDWRLDQPPAPILGRALGTTGSTPTPRSFHCPDTATEDPS